MVVQDRLLLDVDLFAADAEMLLDESSTVALVFLTDGELSQQMIDPGSANDCGVMRQPILFKKLRYEVIVISVVIGVVRLS